MNGVTNICEVRPYVSFFSHLNFKGQFDPSNLENSETYKMQINELPKKKHFTRSEQHSKKITTVIVICAYA